MGPFSVSTSMILVSACFLLNFIQEISASTFDGLPRPKGFPDAPTTAYGKLPTVYVTMNQAADCEWYGFANVNYPADIGLQCLTHTYKTEVVDEANQGTLRPYRYVKCWDNACYDSVWYKQYCVVGCFYLKNSSLLLPPVTALPPPAPPAPPGTTSPGSNTPPGTTTTPSSSTSQATKVLQPHSSVMVLCGGLILAAVGLSNRW